MFVVLCEIQFPSGILDTILSVQPKEGGGGGGETRESIVYQLAEDMLRKLPPQYNAFEVREALNRMGSLLPMNIFFRFVRSGDTFYLREFIFFYILGKWKWFIVESFLVKAFQPLTLMLVNCLHFRDFIYIDKSWTECNV